MQKCVCEREGGERSVCVCEHVCRGRAKGEGAGFLQRSLLLPINCHRGFAVVLQHNPAKKNTDNKTAAEL